VTANDSTLLPKEDQETTPLAKQSKNQMPAQNNTGTFQDVQSPQIMEGTIGEEKNKNAATYHNFGGLQNLMVSSA